MRTAAGGLVAHGPPGNVCYRWNWNKDLAKTKRTRRAPTAKGSER
jgi:hypothetical protein